MPANKLFLMILILTFTFSLSLAQTNIPPGNIKLLAEYTHKKRQGIDTEVGVISKNGGIKISYDIGDLAGNYAKGYYQDEKENLVWSKTQKVRNHNLRITNLKNGAIYATFDEWINFMANVKTNEDLADFLLMIMTYDSERNEFSQWLNLLPNYEVKAGRGIDSAVGKILKKDGLQIGYDIGRMAGNYAKRCSAQGQSEEVWNKTQEVNGLSLNIVSLKNGRICASFIETYANFIADIKDTEQLADFLMMIMTYSSNNEKNKN